MTEEKGRGHNLPDILADREAAAAIIKKFDDEAVWDKIQARDVPAEIVEYVTQRLSDNGFDYPQVRRSLGIKRSTDKAWRKIMAAITAGHRIDGKAWMFQVSAQINANTRKLFNMIQDTLDNGTDVVTKDGDIVNVKGPTKELAGIVSAFNDSLLTFAKIGKEMGAFVESDGGKPGAGVTIVVQTAVRLPEQKAVDAERTANEAKNKEIIIEAKSQHEIRQSQTQLPKN